MRTNSTKIVITMELETLHWDAGMAMFSAQSINVMIGERKNARFAGLVHPSDYETKFCQGEFYKDSSMEDVTLWLPRNEIIKDIRISIENDAQIEAPTPYKYPPIVFYGSSITEGGHSCRVTNVYNALISQHLDVDYYNLGFSIINKKSLFQRTGTNLPWYHPSYSIKTLSLKAVNADIRRDILQFPPRSWSYDRKDCFYSAFLRHSHQTASL